MAKTPAVRARGPSAFSSCIIRWSASSRKREMRLKVFARTFTWARIQEARSPQQVLTVKLTSWPSLAARRQAVNRATQGSFNR